MKILFLLTQDLESPSGLGRYWPMAHAMAARGHEVRIATMHSDWSSLTEKHFQREGVVVDYVAPMHVRKQGSQKQYYSPLQLIKISLQATCALYTSARSQSVDILHVGKPHPMNSIAGIFAAGGKHTALCLDCDDYEAGSNRFQKAWQKSVVAFFEKMMPRLSRLITTNTYFMKDKLQGWGVPDERIKYLPNGIEQKRFTTPSLDEVENLRNRLGIRDKKVVLYLGSLSLVNHPVDLLLRAHALILRELPKAVLLIVGGGEDLDKLQDLAGSLGISQATNFTGRVNPDDVSAYYAVADVSVDPVHENDAAKGRSPLKLFESWQCGIPFVTSGVGDREYLLGQPPAGILANPPGEPGALARVILEVLRSSELSEELRQRGYERVKEFTWDRLAIKLEEEYVKLL